MPGVLVWAVITKTAWTENTEYEKLSLTALRAGKSKIKALADLEWGKSPLLEHRLLPSHRVWLKR